MSGLVLLPAPKDKCQACAGDHAVDLPHNAQSLFYQYWFFAQHQRWPNWKDAMAHCTPEMKALWIMELERMNVDVEGGMVNPTKAKS